MTLHEIYLLSYALASLSGLSPELMFFLVNFVWDSGTGLWSCPTSVPHNTYTKMKF